MFKNQSLEVMQTQSGAESQLEPRSFSAGKKVVFIEGPARVPSTDTSIMAAAFVAAFQVADIRYAIAYTAIGRQHRPRFSRESFINRLPVSSHRLIPTKRTLSLWTVAAGAERMLEQSNRSSKSQHPMCCLFDHHLPGKVPLCLTMSRCLIPQSDFHGI